MVEPYYEIAMYSLIGVGVLIDTFCWKYRKLALGLFAYECTILLLSSTICNVMGGHSSFMIFASLLLNVITLGCHSGVSTFLAMISYFIIQFVLHPST